MTFAGADNEISICESDPSFSLDSLLSENIDPGFWVCPNNEVLAMNTFNPSEHTAGDHFYITTPNAGCQPDSATITVHLQQLPNPGEDGFLLVCSISDPVNLVEFLGGEPDVNGTWLGPDDSNVDEFFDPAEDSPGQYTYQVFGVAPCPTEAATASVNIVEAPYAGPDSTLFLCSIDDPLNINMTLSDEVTEFREWTDMEGNPIIAIEDPSDLVGNVYQLITFGDGPCENDTSIHTVIVNQPVELELLSPVILCSEGEIQDLAEYFEISNSDNFRFIDEDTNHIPQMLEPSTLSTQDATFIVEGMEPCPADSLTFTITIHEPASSGIDTQAALCSTDPTINVNELLEGDPEMPGFWVLEGDTLEQIDFNPSENLGITELEYTAISVAPCPNQSSTLEIEVLMTPEPEFDSNIIEATIENPFFTFDNTTEGPYNYTWVVEETDTLNTFNLEYTFPINQAGEYTICLTAENSIGCQSSICDQVEVKEQLTSFIPNTFTPDGDGFNEVFKLNGLGIDSEFFEFYVFSRNGDMVFSTEDLEEGWDGTYNGEPVPSDIYAYRIVLKVKDSPERRELSGHITLLR